MSLASQKCCPDQSVIHIDDSDVVNPDEYKFESIGWARDGSEYAQTKNVYQKGNSVAKATVLADNHHPVSIFSEIYFSAEKNFTSINDITFSAMECGSAMFWKSYFVMSCSYSDNNMLLKLNSMGQDYVIRFTAKRKLLYHNKSI